MLPLVRACTSREGCRMTLTKPPPTGLGSRVGGLAKPVVRWGVMHGLVRTALRAAARRGDLQARLFMAGPTVPTLDLIGLFDEVRANGPLMKGKFTYLTASHAAVREVLGSNDFRAGIAPADGIWGRLNDWSAVDFIHPM